MQAIKIQSKVALSQVFAFGGVFEKQEKKLVATAPGRGSRQKRMVA